MNALPAKTIALIEFLWVGHHPSFFRLYCRALLAAGWRVLALCPQPLEVESWEPAACREGRLVAQEFTDEVMSHRWRRKVFQSANLYRFEQSARRLAGWEAQTGLRVDLALFACLYVGPAPFGGVDAVFPYPWTGLLLDSGAVRMPGGPRKLLHYRSLDPLAIFRARHCISFATLDEFIGDALHRRTGKPVCMLPEIADDSPPRADFPLAEEICARAAGRRVVGCFGQFARRKGALSFLRLAEACHDEPWFFTWVGAFEERSFSRSEMRWIRSFLAAGPSNCRVEFARVADDPDFNALVALSDVLYLCYHQHVGSSNMISKAAAFDKPVVVSDGYCMADRTRQYDLGLCVPEDDVPATREALHRLLSPGNELAVPRFAAYRADHSPARFAEVVATMAAGNDGCP